MNEFQVQGSKFKEEDTAFPTSLNVELGTLNFGMEAR